MRPNRTAMLAALLAALHCAYPDAALTSALAADAPAATARDDWYGQRVDAAFVAGYAVLPKPEDVTIIDSRPAARKYDRGHIPTAKSVPWARAATEDGTFRTRAELDAIYRDEAGLRDGDDVVAYCRIGERSSHTWFVLTHLLGFGNVRNYDGSWTEWGNAVRVPIVRGTEPGEVPAGSARAAR